MSLFVVDILRKRSKKFFDVGGIRAPIYQHLFLCYKVQENDSCQIRKLIEELLVDFLPNLVDFTHLPFDLFVSVELLLLQLGVALSSMRGIIRYHRGNVAKVTHVIVIIIVEVIVVIVIANVAVPIIIFVLRSTDIGAVSCAVSFLVVSIVFIGPW